MSQLSQIVNSTPYFIYGFLWFSLYIVIISLNRIIQLIFAMMKFVVLGVRTEWLNIIYTSVVIKGLRPYSMRITA
jgi:hypothetical protein